MAFRRSSVRSRLAPPVLTKISNKIYNHSSQAVHAYAVLRLYCLSKNGRKFFIRDELPAIEATWLQIFVPKLYCKVLIYSGMLEGVGGAFVP